MTSLGRSLAITCCRRPVVRTGWWRPRSSHRRCCRRWRKRPGSSTSRRSPDSSGSRRAALSRPGSRFVFGYEEALGYQVGDAVSDKDGLSAALLAAEIAAGAKACGTSLIDRLDSFASRFGVHATAQWSLRLEGRTAQAEDSRDRRALAHTTTRGTCWPGGGRAGGPQQGVEELPATDALVLRLANRARVVLRPSGTEPKLKVYFEVVTAPVPPEGVGAAPRGRPAPRFAREQRRGPLSVDEGFLGERGLSFGPVL